MLFFLCERRCLLSFHNTKECFSVTGFLRPKLLRKIKYPFKSINGTDFRFLITSEISVVF